jgi:DDB1- and CUL4-associated factor 7
MSEFPGPGGVEPMVTGSGAGVSGGRAAGTTDSVQHKKEIYTYEAPWLVYGLSWSERHDHPYRLAVGSFVDDYANQVRVVSLDQESGEFVSTGEFEHPYPPTKVQWIPDPQASHPDLIATTGDYLRLWHVGGEESSDAASSSSSSSASATTKNAQSSVVGASGTGGAAGSTPIVLRTLLNNNRTFEFCAPLTSLDWNREDPSLIGTSSIDTTCTVWNVEREQVVTQLIAHDKDVYDFAWSYGTNVFATVGADGSVRVFDLRSLEHSTIVYETGGTDPLPLLRVSWNKIDHNYLATMALDSNQVTVLDIRMPSVPAATLSGHEAPVNSLAWAPHSSCHLCTAAEDQHALIWDLSPLPSPVEDPILAYGAGEKINQVQWSSSHTDWISIAFANKLQILRV